MVIHGFVLCIRGILGKMVAIMVKSIGVAPESPPKDIF